MSEAFDLVAIIQTNPETEAQVLAAVTPCVLATRLEPGCLDYRFNAVLGAPGRYVFLERWTDLAALDAHMKTPHFLAMAEVLEGLVEGGFDVLKLKPLV